MGATCARQRSGTPPVWRCRHNRRRWIARPRTGDERTRSGGRPTARPRRTWSGLRWEIEPGRAPPRLSALLTRISTSRVDRGASTALLLRRPPSKRPSPLCCTTCSVVPPTRACPPPSPSFSPPRPILSSAPSQRPSSSAARSALPPNRSRSTLARPACPGRPPSRSFALPLSRTPTTRVPMCRSSPRSWAARSSASQALTLATSRRRPSRKCSRGRTKRSGCWSRSQSQ